MRVGVFVFVLVPYQVIYIVSRSPHLTSSPHPVPRMSPPLARALVVGAGNLDRLQHALEAEFLETCIGDVEVLQTPTDLLARQRLLAELFLRLADRPHAH